jgi:hypothetical protein
MKKNVMLKIASVLMIAVLLTTCAISSTFAKYVTKGVETTDSARVAKWGVGIKTDATGLFLKEYDGEGDVSVQATSSDVVAPGTTNTAKISTDITGTPEVAFEVTTVATVTLGGWDADYCPITFNINGTGYSFRQDGHAEESVSDYATRIAGVIVSQGTQKFAANTTYAAEVSDLDITVTWAWAFSTSEDNDILDTKYGNYADAALPTIDVKITQTASQIDTYTPAPVVGG